MTVRTDLTSLLSFVGLGRVRRVPPVRLLARTERHQAQAASSASGSCTPCEARLRLTTRSYGLTHLSCHSLLNVAPFHPQKKLAQLVRDGAFEVASTDMLRGTRCRLEKKGSGTLTIQIFGKLRACRPWRVRRRSSTRASAIKGPAASRQCRRVTHRKCPKGKLLPYCRIKKMWQLLFAFGRRETWPTPEGFSVCRVVVRSMENPSGQRRQSLEHVWGVTPSVGQGRRMASPTEKTSD